MGAGGGYRGFRSRAAVLSDSARFQRVTGFAMSKNKHTKQTQQNPKNQTAMQANKTCPDWYPDLPEKMVSKSCLLILWSIMTGQSLAPRNGLLTNTFNERIKEILAGRAKLVPELILEMAMAIHPGATHEMIKEYLRGISETVIVSQSVPLPSIPHIFEDYPHIMPVQEKLKGLEASKDALDSIRDAVEMLKDKSSPELGN